MAGFATSVLPGQSLILPGTILLNEPGDTSSRPTWATDGSFLAFRQLQQFVPEFNKYLLENPVNDALGTLTPTQGSELLGARMIGRWKSVRRFTSARREACVADLVLSGRSTRSRSR